MNILTMIIRSVYQEYDYFRIKYLNLKNFSFMNFQSC